MNDKNKIKSVVKKNKIQATKTSKGQIKTGPSSKVNSKKNPQTMDDLIQQTGYQVKGLKKGQTVKGLVTEISKRHILIDIGAKTEGIVTSKEFSYVKEYVDELKEGDEIEAIVGSPENEKGQILLSLRKAASDYKWDLFQNYKDTGEPIDVRGLEINKGGVIVRHKGVRGFVPASQFGREWLGNLQQLQNKVFIVKVIEIDREKNRLIFSEKLVSEAKALKNQDQALQLVKVGQVYEGTVSGIMPFGVFIRVDVEKSKKLAENTNISLFLEGLVHISEVSWQKVEDLNKMFKVGQKVNVKVLSVNEETGKLNLSIKQLLIDPWLELVKKYKKDSKAKGNVSKLAPFGAFVTLEDGVEGLLHISKIPADFEIKVGQSLDTYIESIDVEKKKISLGLVLTSKPVGYK